MISRRRMRKKSTSITCPDCGYTSYNPNDIREGFCGLCHDWTSKRPDRWTGLEITVDAYYGDHRYGYYYDGYRGGWCVFENSTTGRGRECRRIIACCQSRSQCDEWLTILDPENVHPAAEPEIIKPIY